MARISKEQSGNTKIYKGVIPFCLDDKFGTVDAILGQNSSMKNAISGGLTAMVQYVKSLLILICQNCLRGCLLQIYQERQKRN